MAEIVRHNKRYGLIGKDISYSFSKGYFTEKFQQLGLNNYSYENFDVQATQQIQDVLSRKNVFGLNVTIPYKEAILDFLDDMDSEARAIGAVNTVKFSKNGLIGFNTDAYGFKQSLVPLLNPSHKKALVLGTGGASKAIVHVLSQLGIKYHYVSRMPKQGQLSYLELDRTVIEEHLLIINCSPVGTYPNVEEKPIIPYQFITKEHFLYDLIYNPSKTAFLMQGEKKGASIQNGLPMLELQAEKAWEIWNS